jgi:hypothetical protein
MVRRSAAPQNLSSEMLSETVQQENHVFSLPTGPAIKLQKLPQRMHQSSSCLKCPMLSFALTQGSPYIIKNIS